MKNLVTRVSLCTRLWLACLLAIFLGSHAQGQNTFTNTGSLATGRYLHSAALLHSGKVLVTGGYGSSDYSATAELYDPATGRWTAAGALATSRAGHTMTVLPNGKVLVVGGTNSVFLTSVELYDPAAGTWTATGPIATARGYHTATLLPNGKVLVAGGVTTGGLASLASTELYDPATGIWTATGTLAEARSGHTATLLPNGKVLVAGGRAVFTIRASAELYDLATGTWTATTPMTVPREGHTATLLPNGKVLVAGGSLDTGATASAELYDPATSTWTATGVSIKRQGHSATLLSNGKVLVCGGTRPDIGVLASAELYNAGGTWSPASALISGRSSHTATLLHGGQVLIAAGRNTSGVPHASAELFNPATGAWSAATPMLTARAYHTATLLPDGKILVAGGITAGNVYLASAELYDPATGLWSAATPMLAARASHTATLLPNGKVLVAGGLTPNGALIVASASAELYDPATGTWSGNGGLLMARVYLTATLLPTGKVLVVGGQRSASTPTSGDLFAMAELYDPASGSWTATGSLGYRRSLHTATLLTGGSVLVVGGRGAPFDSNVEDLNSAEIYHLPSGTWSSAGLSGTARSSHTATLLPSGKVLVTNGTAGSSVIYDPATGWSAAGTVESGSSTLLPNGKVLLAGQGIYDPATGLSTSTGALGTARTRHTATLLPSGKVLLAGGLTSGPTYLASAELYDAGLGFSAAWQPQIASASFDASARLVLIGTGFRGISSASGGNGAQDSPTNYPLVQLRRLGNEQSVFLSPDPATAVSATGFTSAPLAPFAGHSVVTVFANGIPSAARFATGQTILTTRDTDGDGLNDAAEFQLASLGFDMNLSQPAQVNAMFSNLNVALPNLNAAGFYTTAQVQALNVGVPLIQRNATTGQFKLTIGLEKSTNLSVPNSFVPFPFLGPGTVINGQGKIEFLFTAPDNAAFFRLQSQ